MGLTFFILLFIMSFPHQVNGFDDSNCCSKVEEKCKFICSNTFSNDGSLYDNVMCVSSQIQYFSCKLNISQGAQLASVVRNVSNAVEQNWSNINDILKFLSNKELRKLTVKELLELPQELMARLKSLPGMTDEQFNGIIHHLNNFTPDDLKMFLDKVDSSILLANLTFMLKDLWNKVQLQSTAETFFKDFGDQLQNMVSKELDSLGKFVAELPSIELLQLSSKTFDESLEKLCNVELYHVQQKIAMLTPIMKLFGIDDNWNDIVITRMCQFLMGLSVEDMHMTKAKEIIGSLSAIQKYFNEFEKDIRELLLTKIREVWSEASKWAIERIAGVGNFINGIDVTDIESLNLEQIMGFLEIVDKDILDKVQLTALGQKLVTIAMESLPADLVQKISKLMENLEVIIDQPMVLGKLTIIPFLEMTKGIEWAQKLTRVFLNYVKEMEKLLKLKAENMKDMGTIMKALTSGEIGQMSRDVLVRHLPELGMLSALGEPVLRYMIKVYKDESRNKKGIESLGDFIMALKRYDIEGMVMDNILTNLNAYKQVYFNEEQNFKMVEDLEKVLSMIKEVGSSDSTFQPLEYKNVAKMGNVPSFFTNKQFQENPMSALEYMMESFGKDDKLKSEVYAVIKRMNKYWEDKKLSNLKDFDIEMLGKFVVGFMIENIWAMTKEVIFHVFEKLGEFTGLSHEKLKTRANTVYTELKELVEKYGLFNEKTILTMWNLLTRLIKDTFKEINPELIRNNLFKLVDIPDKDEENLRAIFEMIKNEAGVSVEQFTADQWKRFGKALQTLNVDEILAINADAFKYVIDILGTFDSWSDEQINAVMIRVKNIFGEDVSKWSFKTFAKIGTFINRLGSGDIEKIDKELLIDIADLFEHASNTTVKTITKRIMEEVLKNDVLNLNITIVKSIRNVLQGFDTDVLQKINFDSPDLISEFGKVENWSTSQLKVLSKKADEYLKKTKDDENKYLYLGNLAKGMTADMIRQMSAESFKNAAGVLGKITGFTKEQKEALAAKAKEAWGDDVSIWTAAMIRDANQTIDGLLSTDLAKINPVFIKWIPANVLSQMEVRKLIAFTKEQILSFTEEQIEAVNRSHFKVLPADFVDALKHALNENKDHPKKSKLTNYHPRKRN